MSKFDVAFDVTMGHEGGYSNDPDDPGGETYRGISRKHHPLWTGWALVNPRHINEKVLDPYVREFYLIEYWDKLKCQHFSQIIANELFDTGVNVGKRVAGTFFQQGLNLLNKNETLYKNIVVDGWIGPATIRVHHEMPLKYKKVLAKIMNILQGHYYIMLMESDERREKWVGWFGRVHL